MPNTIKDYNEAVFIKALEEAGFQRDRSVYQYGAIFYTKPIRKGLITVSLYQGHYTASVCSGFAVRDLISASRNPHELIVKVEDWEAGIYGNGVSPNLVTF